MAWMPDLHLRPSRRFCFVIVLLHTLAYVALIQLPRLWWIWLPVVGVVMLLNLMKYGLLLQSGSVIRVWLGSRGWFLKTRKGTVFGPFNLDASSRMGDRFTRLSLRQSRWKCQNVMITPGMVGEEAYHQLQLFLRWAPDKNQLSQAHAE